MCVHLADRLITDPLGWIYLGGFEEQLSSHDGINKMHGWFRKLLKTRGSLSIQNKKDEIITKDSVTSAGSLSYSSASPLPAVPPGKSPSKPRQQQLVLASEQRWKKKYDLFVCHSSTDSDMEEATQLVLSLEAAPHELRCFLWHRDACPGAAVTTEFGHALEDSHVWALLITPSFVQDDWCKYMMHQVLAEGPMSNRMIPLLQNLPHTQYPMELRFYYYIDLSRNPHRGHNIVNKTVLGYLENLVKEELKSDHKLDESERISQKETSKQCSTVTSTDEEEKQTLQ
ncbi:toll/interleukin-1 receptor domain-containing adapter protein [Oryzias melastigma]|uniref:Toll-interleukin 1 receptor (TIR) domain containing adaptor protein n=1 Tax=Oryzias melastigma TaxID=30732 RepID=A0A3B3BH70_ORYME|nr:toll/interleukin-1 receptor domain-containing adapter protein [Oryzias melastigma]